MERYRVQVVKLPSRINIYGILFTDTITEARKLAFEMVIDEKQKYNRRMIGEIIEIQGRYGKIVEVVKLERGKMICGKDGGGSKVINPSVINSNGRIIG